MKESEILIMEDPYLLESVSNFVNTDDAPRLQAVNRYAWLLEWL
jgi:hypothetical protein